MFEDEKIDFIESLPEADTILVIWIKLLTLAGKLNSNGYIFLTEKIPYTDEMLSHKFRRSLNTIKLALNTLEKLDMVRFNEKGVLKIANWEKHQNIDGLDKIREQNRVRQARYRDKQKALEDNVTITLRNGTDIEEDIDIDIEEEKKKTVPYQKILDMYHEKLPDLPKVIKLNDSRRKSIKSRLEEYSLKEIETVFDKSAESDFLTGKAKDWSANFDWIMKPSNFIKILEGNYDNRQGGQNGAGATKPNGRIEEEGEDLATRAGVLSL
jgi:predicted phage replisome organizer